MAKEDLGMGCDPRSANEIARCTAYPIFTWFSLWTESVVEMLGNICGNMWNINRFGTICNMGVGSFWHALGMLHSTLQVGILYTFFQL